MACNNRNEKFGEWQDGDVVFFSGRGLKSRLIQLVTLDWRVYLVALVLGLFFSALRLPLSAFAWPLTIITIAWHLSPKISHVAIVATDGYLQPLWESTTLCREPCIVQNRVVKGVQAHWPAERVANYRGRVWRMRLRQPLAFRERLRLSKAVTGYLGRDYDTVGAALSATNLVKWWFAPRRRLVAFCSQYVAHCLKQLDARRVFPVGILSRRVHPNLLWRILNDTEAWQVPERLK